MENKSTPTVAVLTVSDRSARGERPDAGGPAVVDAVTYYLGWQVLDPVIVPDDINTIMQTLHRLAADGADLIFTTGGTGFSPRDVTPEATRKVIEREAPGLVEAVRAASMKITPHAMLSRAVAGILRQTLIINLPGNPKAGREALEVLAPVLPHAISTLRGDSGAEQAHRKPPTHIV